MDLYSILNIELFVMNYLIFDLNLLLIHYPKLMVVVVLIMIGIFLGATFELSGIIIGELDFLIFFELFRDVKSLVESVWRAVSMSESDEDEEFEEFELLSDYHDSIQNFIIQMIVTRVC
jgi:hypothetical protein